MILSFNKQFVPKIILGSKIHTIRTDTKDRWQPGKNINFATGIRTKNYKQFHTGICISTQKIVITPTPKNTPVIFIDDKKLYWSQIKKLIKNDGFETVQELKDWFNKPFTGKIIHWTELRY